MWVVWKKSEALARCGNGWIDLYGGTFTYHDACDTRAEAEAEIQKIKTKPTMEEWLKMNLSGPGGMYVVDAICRPVGHNPNWEK